MGGRRLSGRLRPNPFIFIMPLFSVTFISRDYPHQQHASLCSLLPLQLTEKTPGFNYPEVQLVLLLLLEMISW